MLVYYFMGSCCSEYSEYGHPEDWHTFGGFQNNTQGEWRTPESTQPGISTMNNRSLPNQFPGGQPTTTPVTPPPYLPPSPTSYNPPAGPNSPFKKTDSLNLPGESLPGATSQVSNRSSTGQTTIFGPIDEQIFNKSNYPKFQQSPPSSQMLSYGAPTTPKTPLIPSMGPGMSMAPMAPMASRIPTSPSAIKGGNFTTAVSAVARENLFLQQMQPTGVYQPAMSSRVPLAGGQGNMNMAPVQSPRVYRY